MKNTTSSDLRYECLSALEKLHGDAFFLVNLRTFEKNFRDFLSSFQTLYSKSSLAYSYKTNYLPHICRLVNRWGGYAEVVSRLEYDLARQLGVKPQRIIFNGPYKRPEDVAHALEEGALVNLDGPHQLDSLEKHLASVQSDRSYQVGLRVTFSLEGVAPSRFGFDADSDELSLVLRRLQRLGRVSVVGLHCHFSTPRRSPENYRFIATRMIALAEKHLREAPLRFLDIGGGYFSRMPPELAQQFNCDIPTFENYAEAIASCFAKHYGSQEGPELILEPGVSITADTARFVAKVIDVHCSGPRRLALVAGSVHVIKPTLNRLNLPLHVVESPDRSQALSGPLQIVGYTCMERDVLLEGYTGSLARGDYVVFNNVGAYTNVLKPPFIREAPPMLAWDASLAPEAMDVLRRGETMREVFSTYDLG